jgi:hypothetical protein
MLTRPGADDAADQHDLWEKARRELLGTET